MNRTFMIFDNKLINPDHIIHIALIHGCTQEGIEIQCVNECYTKYYSNECDRNQEFDNLMDNLVIKNKI